MVEKTQAQPGAISARPAAGIAALARRLPWTAIATWAAVLLAMLALPRVITDVWLNNVILILTAVVAVTGLNLLVGYTGQISLGQAAFAMMGAFTVALMYDRWPELRTRPYQLYLTLPAAGLSGLLAGTLFGVPSLRVKGLYLAIATLAAHPILTWIVEHLYPELTVKGAAFSSLPIPRPIIGIPGWERTIRSPEQQYYFFAVLAIIGIIVARNIVRSRVGRALIAVRDNDIAAESSGVSLYKYKLTAFAVGSFYAGIAGAMLAYYFRIATVESFTIGRSVEYLAMVIIGGMGSIAGPVLGAIFIVAGPIVLREQVIERAKDAVPRLEKYYDFIREMLFGLLIILFIIWEPEGLYKLWLRLKAALRRLLPVGGKPAAVGASGGDARGSM